MNLMWGVEGMDHKGVDYFDAEQRGKLVWDVSFDLAEPAAQEHLLAFCAELRNGECLTQICRNKTLVRNGEVSVCELRFGGSINASAQRLRQKLQQLNSFHHGLEVLNNPFPPPSGEVRAGRLRPVAAGGARAAAPARGGSVGLLGQAHGVLPAHPDAGGCGDDDGRSSSVGIGVGVGEQTPERLLWRVSYRAGV
jgi:hypothetical protein